VPSSKPRTKSDTTQSGGVGFFSQRCLNLRWTKVTDARLKELAGLKNLSFLSLDNTTVTVVGLKQLAGLKNVSSC